MSGHNVDSTKMRSTNEKIVSITPPSQCSPMARADWSVTDRQGARHVREGHGQECAGQGVQLGATLVGTNAIPA